MKDRITIPRTAAFAGAAMLIGATPVSAMLPTPTPIPSGRRMPESRSKEPNIAVNAALDGCSGVANTTPSPTPTPTPTR